MCGGHLVSESADLGVWDVENGSATGGRDDGDLGVSPAQLQQTLVVGGQRLSRDRHVVVVA